MRQIWRPFLQAPPDHSATNRPDPVTFLCLVRADTYGSQLLRWRLGSGAIELVSDAKRSPPTKPSDPLGAHVKDVADRAADILVFVPSDEPTSTMLALMCFKGGSHFRHVGLDGRNKLIESRSNKIFKIGNELIHQEEIS